jgi:hypothetical protein
MRKNQINPPAAANSRIRRRKRLDRIRSTYTQHPAPAPERGPHGDDVPLALDPFDDRALLVGQHLGLYLIDPSSRATAWAVVRLSPVSMTTRMPAALSAASACGVEEDFGLIAVTKERT